VSTNSFQRALEFVKKKHAGQIRAGNVPAWHHLVRVSYLLQNLLTQYEEGTPEERDAIIIAALGHDILEDTDATRDEVASIFGDRAAELVWGMTNEWGDGNIAPYVEKIVASEEAVRLIKLSDGFDNNANVVYNMPLLGTQWVTSYFLPVVKSMQETVTKTEFKAYPKTAATLIAMVKNSFLLLKKELEIFSKQV